MTGHPEADLGVYVLGVLPGEASTRLRLHLEGCAACRARVGDLEGTSELLSAARLAPEAPPGLVETALASLPPRNTDTERASAAAAAGAGARANGVDGDFVLGRTDAPVRASPRRRALTVALIGAALLVCAASAWALRPGAGEAAIPLTAHDGTASGTVRAIVDDAGADLLLHAAGLATGSYSVELDGRPAGSFRSGDGVADVELHAAASSGRLEVRRDPDTALVLEADLP